MKSFNKIITAICFGVLLTPGFASAVTITNSIEATAVSGGQTIVNGADGKDGQDGKDGKDGADGKDGEVIESKSRSSASVKTTVNGEVIEDIKRVKEVEGKAVNAQAKIQTKVQANNESANSTSSSSVEVDNSPTREPETRTKADARNDAKANVGIFSSLLSSIRIMIETYAKNLF